MRKTVERYDARKKVLEVYDMAEDMERSPGSTFRSMRKALGLTCKALAKLLDVTPETVSRWERGTCGYKIDRSTFAVVAVMVDEAREGRTRTADRLRALGGERSNCAPGARAYDAQINDGAATSSSSLSLRDRVATRVYLMYMTGDLSRETAQSENAVATAFRAAQRPDNDLFKYAYLEADAIILDVCFAGSADQDADAALSMKQGRSA